MVGWSVENATKAYLGAMEMGKGPKEPNSAEFISAMAAGTNARVIVVACVDAAEPTVLALAAAADQTDGKVVCILHSANAEEALGPIAAGNMEFVVGNAEGLILSEYMEAECVAVDCRISNSERILKAARNTIVLGYNALWKEQWRCTGFDARWLPIGQGLLLNRPSQKAKEDGQKCGSSKRARWVVKVDRFTGEEHIFRLREKQPKPT